MLEVPREDEDAFKAAVGPFTDYGLGYLVTTSLMMKVPVAGNCFDHYDLTSYLNEYVGENQYVCFKLSVGG